MPTVREIISEYLAANGYDGLVNPGECACPIDDLFPCMESWHECRPGYKGPCTCGEGCDFDLYTSKEAAAAAEKELNEDEQIPSP